ncbi:MAG: VanW family protein [Akkermansiaceae bacterium]
MNKTEISEPVRRGWLRRVLGREYYIARRALGWWVDAVRGRKVWARQVEDVDGRLGEVGGKFFGHVVFEHRSVILRKLAGVDMRLQENKRRNLELAIAHLNGVVIRQGETFSVWKNVGRPTRGKGYLEGLVLQQGQLSSGVGGGICQLGNLLFWLFAHSPLIVTERYRHGFDVFPDVGRKVPFGAGATLAYNYIDLQVLNESVDDYRVELWMDDDFLYGRLLCESPLEVEYRVEERNHEIRQQFWGGYSRHNEVVQVRTDGDGVVSERVLVRNDAIMMYAPFLENKVND